MWQVLPSVGDKNPQISQLGSLAAIQWTYRICKFMKERDWSINMQAEKQTNGQTDKHTDRRTVTSIAIPRIPIGGEINIFKVQKLWLLKRRLICF